MEYPQRTIKYLSFGSPLMDAIRDVSDEFMKKYFLFNYFHRYNIVRGTSIQKSVKEVKCLKEFVKQGSITYVPGGCQFNAMTVFNVKY